MKSINRTDFIEIGTVHKVHGTKGEIKLALSKQVLLKKWAFLEFQGKPVPFYIEQKTGNADEPIVKLEGINDPISAQALQGKNLLFPSNLVKASKANQVENVVGYALVDIALGQIGILKAIEELPNQLMLITNYKDKEVFIPAVEEFIVEIDDKRKQVLLDLPQGLLEI